MSTSALPSNELLHRRQHRHARRLFAALAVLLLIAQAQTRGDEHYFDLRGSSLPKELELSGKEADKFVKSEAAGFRITLPSDRKNFTPVSLRTRFGLQGDFEITTTVEILQAESPASAGSIGVGVTLYVEKVDPPGEGTNVGRLMRAEGKDLIMWDRKFVIAGGEPRYDGGDQRCTEKLVRLRLVRKGSQLFYLWAPGAGGDFQRIHEGDFGTADLKEITVKVTTGSEPRLVDVRVLDLRITSGEPTEEEGWLRIGLFVGAAVLVLAIAAGLCLRFLIRRGSKPNVNGEASAPAPTPVHSFPCAECGKRLKVKVELIGKKIKCPHCAKAVLVPDSQENAM